MSGALRLAATAMVVLVTGSALLAKPAAKVLEVGADAGIPADVQIVNAKGDAADAKVGDILEESDRIRTGYKSRAKLDFFNKATVVVEELSEFKVAVFKLGKSSQVELWLKAGELQAQVRKEAAARTQFVVRSATATASVRGTKIQQILVTPSSGMRIHMGPEGSLFAQGSQGAGVSIDKNQRGTENTENGTFTPDSKIVLTSSNTAVTPSSLPSNEVTAATNQTLTPITSPPVGATGGGTVLSTNQTATLVIHLGGPNGATFVP